MRKSFRRFIAPLACFICSVHSPLPRNSRLSLLTVCGPEGLVEISFLRARVVAELANRKDVTPGTLPMFMLYNAGMSVGGPHQSGLLLCWPIALHPSRRPDYLQTFSPFDFDVSWYVPDRL